MNRYSTLTSKIIVALIYMMNFFNFAYMVKSAIDLENQRIVEKAEVKKDQFVNTSNSVKTAKKVILVKSIIK